MKLSVIAFVCIILCQQATLGACERVHHRRRAKLRRSEHVVTEQANNVHQQQEHVKSVPELLDLTGSFSGTWTRLPDYDSSNPRRKATAVDADAATALASEKLENSGWPSILTRALSGRLLLKLHSGPANQQGIAGVEGVLSVSEGALVLGPALKRLSLSGFTRLDRSNNQGIYAVMSPQSPIRIAPPDFTSGPGNAGRSTLSSPQQPHSQQQQQDASWLSPWPRQRSGKGAPSLTQQLAWILRSSAGDETAAAAAAAMTSSQSLPTSSTQGAAGECKFRLELTVTRADDFWTTAATSHRAAAAAAAAAATAAPPPRAAMHSLHQKVGQGPATARLPPQSSQQQQQKQQQHGEAVAPAGGFVLGPQGPLLDTGSTNYWGLSWQQYFGLDEQEDDQQLERQRQQQVGVTAEPPYPVPSGRRSAMEVPLPAGLNTVLRIPLAPAGSPAIGVMDDLEAAAADTDYAAGYEAGYAAAAAEAEAVATAAVAAAEAARSAAAAIAALPRPYQAVGASSQAATRALKARDFPSMDKVVLKSAGPGAAAGAGAQDSWQVAPVARSMIEQGGHATAVAPPEAPAAAAAPATAGAAAPGITDTAATAAEAPSDIDSSSRYGVKSLFDTWLLPCTHPKQRDTPVCRQQLLSGALRTSSSSSFSSSSRSLETSSSISRQQPRLHLQGLLVSDNCNAQWALSAVALPPGGLEVQALWYALLALLVCLVQVMLLRKQAAIVTRSSAVALRVSLVGICAGAQIDAFLSMAHLAASMSSPDISMPLLVVAAAQFALFAGADMTLLLHVWRAHDHHHQQQQRYSRQYMADAADATITPTAGDGTSTNNTSNSGRTGSTSATTDRAIEGMTGFSTQWLAAGAHMGPYRPTSFVGLWALPVLLVVAIARHAVARIRWLCSGGRGTMGLLDSVVLGIEQLATGRSLLMLYVRFYLVLLSATILSWFMTSQLPLLLLAAFSFWIPQIWHNIAHTARQPLQPGFILVCTAARLLLPVYLLCCPLNLLQLTPQPWLAAALLTWVGLQVAVLLLQHYSNPHIILPASWAPVRYNYHRVEVPWQFKQAAAEAAAAAKAAACAAYDPSTQSLRAPVPMEQPAGGGSGHLTCCCTGVSGACHLCSSRRYILQESYGSASNSCTIRLTPRRQSSAAGAAAALRTNRAMLATETPLLSIGRTGNGSSSSSSNWRLQTATSAPQQQLQQQVQAADGSNGYVQHMPCGNCGDKLTPSCCNSFCNGSRQGQAAGSAGSSRWAVTHLSQQDPQHDTSHAALQAPYQGNFRGGSMTRSTSSGAQLQSSCQHDGLQVVHQQQQQLVVSLPPGASVELSSSFGCQRCCQCNGSGGWAPPGSSPAGGSSDHSSSTAPAMDRSSDDLLHDVVEGYDAFTGDGVIECVICMAGVRLLPVSERFVTPCGHFFHPECLTSWMEVKAECPQCRGPLPPL